MTPSSPSQQRRTVRELIEAKDPDFMASCRRIAASNRAELERLAALPERHPDLIDTDDDGAVEVHDPAEIRAELERAWEAPAAVRPDTGSNAAQQALQHLQLLGKDPRQTWFRSIRHGKGANRRRRGADLHGFNEAELRADAAENAALYFVVGNARTASGKKGAVKNNDVETLPALFVEWDDMPVQEQLTAWEQLGLPEPTLMLTTGGASAHLYWRLQQPATKAEWDAITARLIAHCKSDTNCAGAARVMRLAGSRYIDKKTGQPTGSRAEIVHEAPEAIYTLEEITACLPAPATAPSPAATAPSKAIRPTQQPAPAARPLEQVHEALLQIPQILPDTGQRERFRSLAWGLLCAVREAGADDGMALALLEEHSPLVRDAAEYLKTDPHSVTAATFWHLAREAGWKPEREQRRQQKASATAPDAPRPTPAEAAAEATGLAWLLDRLDTGTGPAGARKTTAGDLAQSLMVVAGSRLRFNQQTLLAEIDGQPIEGTSLDTMHVALQLRGMNVTAENTVAAVATAALQHPYHPVTEYLDRVAADPAIEPLDLTALVGMFLRPGDPPGTLQARMLAKTLIGAVARAFEPGCKHDTACTLVGEQGAQKSTFWEALAGPAFYSSSSLGRLEKDSLMLVHATWFLEIAELETVTGKRAAGELKNFLSTRVDCFRPPYGKTMGRHQRPSVMVATSNRTDFLTDETGSRRFWIIPVTAKEIDVAGVRAIRDRIWKSAVLAYRRGERWWLDKADEAASEIENKEFSASHPWESPISDWLAGRGRTPFTSAEALVHAGLRQRDQIHRRDEMALATVMAGMGWVQRRIQHGRTRQRMWLPAADAPVPNLPDLPDLGTGEVGQRDRLKRNDSQPCAQPARPEIKDWPEAVPVRGSDTQHKVSREKRSGTPGSAREASHSQGSGCPTLPVEVGHEVGHGPEVGHEAPATVADWCEVALAELRLAPHLMHLPEVMAWLRARDAGVSQRQAGDALERLRQADADHDQPTLLDTP